MERLEYNFDNIPTSWETVTLNKFIGIKRLYDEYEDKVPVVKLLAYITEKDESYINEMPALLVEKLVEKIVFLKENPPAETSNEVTIDGETYRINTEEDLKFQEFVDVQTVLQNDHNNFVAILGILCRKGDEKYNDKFIAQTLNHRIEIFGNASMKKIQPLLNFFLLYSQTLTITTPQYLQELKQQANLTVANCENFLKNGAGKKRCSIWQMIKLWRLKRSVKHILRQF